MLDVVPCPGRLGIAHWAAMCEGPCLGGLCKVGVIRSLMQSAHEVN